MEFSIPSSSNNFSSIARRLLLNREVHKNTDPAPLLAQDILGSKADEKQTVLVPQEIPDSKPPAEEPPTFQEDNITDFEPPVEQATLLLPQEIHDVKQPVHKNVLLLPVSGYRSDQFVRPLTNDDSDAEVPTADLLCERIRKLTPEKLMAPLEGCYDVIRGRKPDAEGRPSLGRRTKVVIRRVRQFFEELKKLLGESSNGTVFNSAVQMTAMACGVSVATVTRLGVRSDFVHELFPRKKRKPTATEESAQEATLRKYGEEWGKVVRYFIKEKLRKESMTIAALHEELRKAYVDFPMSRNTLYRFTKALGVTYGRKRGIAYMLL